MLPEPEKQKEFKQALCSKLPKQSCHSWLEPLKLVKITPSKIVFGGIPHAIYRYEIKSNYETVIREIMQEVFPENGPFAKHDFVYKIESGQLKKKAFQPEFNLEFDEKEEKQDQVLNEISVDSNESEKGYQLGAHNISQLNVSSQKEEPGVSLENSELSKDNYILLPSNDGQQQLGSFIPGERNLLASRACNAVAELPGMAFNPFFVYGNSGTGKTHLLQGLGDEISRKHKDKKIIYVSAEDFLNGFVSKVRTQQMKEFRDHYRTADVFLLDDFQVMMCSAKCQMEYLYTISALRQRGAQIVVASQMPISKMTQLIDELKGRLESGLSVDVGLPDLETRIQILMNKAQRSGIPMEHSLAQFMVEHIDGGIGRLEGALTRLGVHASLLNEKLTIDLAKKTLKDWLRDEVISETQFSTNSDHSKVHLPGSTEALIIQRVCAMFQVSLDHLKSYSRERSLVKARQATAFLLKELTPLSLNEIGNILDRNHSTIHASLKKVKSLIATDTFFQKQMQSMIDEFTEEEIHTVFREKKHLYKS